MRALSARRPATRIGGPPLSRWCAEGHATMVRVPHRARRAKTSPGGTGHRGSLEPALGGVAVPSCAITPPREVEPQQRPHPPPLLADQGRHPHRRVRNRRRRHSTLDGLSPVSLEQPSRTGRNPRTRDRTAGLGSSRKPRCGSRVLAGRFPHPLCMSSNPLLTEHAQVRKP
jgi:hypothetical protein